MKTEFKTLYKLSVALMMCGLVLFIYTGCGGYDEAEEAEGTYAAQGASFGLIPPNGAAYNDVFFKDYGTNPLIDTEDDHLSTFGMDVDTLNEAKRVFVENLTGTLQLIAKDAKVQVDFNPQVVSRFRLLGYENRRLDHEEFRDDRADGGEVGAGHSVTALYEIKLSEGGRGHLATVSIRYEDPDTRRISEINEEIFTTQLKRTFKSASPEFQLAATVAEFAEILRESFWAKDGNLAAVSQSLRDIAPRIHNEQVDEFRHMVSRAARFKALDGE